MPMATELALTPMVHTRYRELKHPVGRGLRGEPPRHEAIRDMR